MHALCHNFEGLVVARTLLGIFEAACQPIFVVLSSMWYKREEQAGVVIYWYMMNVCFPLILICSDISNDDECRVPNKLSADS